MDERNTGQLLKKTQRTSLGVHVNDDRIPLARISRVLHSGHVEHPPRGHRHVGVMVLVVQVHHFRDPRLNDHLAAVVAREQGHV